MSRQTLSAGWVLSYVSVMSMNDFIHEKADCDCFSCNSDELHEMLCDYQHKGHSASDFIEEVIIDGLSAFRDYHVCEKSCWRADKMN